VTTPGVEPDPSWTLVPVASTIEIRGMPRRVQGVDETFVATADPATR